MFFKFEAIYTCIYKKLPSTFVIKTFCDFLAHTNISIYFKLFLVLYRKINKRTDLMSCSMNDNQAFNEMMVHIPLCTHKEPSNILIIGQTSPALKKEAEKHNANIEYGDIAFLNSKNEKNIDAVILTDVKLDELVLANIDRILKDEGLITFSTQSFQSDEDKLKEDLQLVGTKFWIAMPFRFGHNTSIIASKKYHPTADLILQRADLLDDLKYYSAEMHQASFVFPAAIHKALTGIARR